MKIPERCKEILRDDPLYACVMQSLAELEPWLSSERPPFFPEYTNHGVSHVEHVFQTAENLIRSEAWQVLTPADVAALLLSIAIHDSAMHLTPESFIALLRDPRAEYRIRGLDTNTWADLWDDFIAEASRFDGRKLQDIFGDAEPVRAPVLDVGRMTLRDRKVIGEFLRHHHHRLAHEIALFGVPGLTAQRIRLHDVPEDIADLAGLVARSHGMSVRTCINYLQWKYNNRCEHSGVHAVFLMCLLRVADYLHIESGRAPRQVLKVTSLASPVSKGHFDLHDAVRDIRISHPDPEAIDVHAVPRNVHVFLKTKQLLDSIQEEMDSSWAILGEVYGRMTHNSLHLLGLRFRRITSNLDNVENFAKTVSYLPVHAAFDCAGADLLKLLIEPLYGSDPVFGVRELIQNAVDAVRERWEYESAHTGVCFDFPVQEADVEILVEKEGRDKVWFTISDKGIGMTSETICEYFLRAGASLRDSATWRRDFADEQGNSRVLRSGRFGIGALATFLIGDSLEVTTRHVSAARDEAIFFVARLDTQNIELTRTVAPVGTRIRLRVHDSIVEERKIPDHMRSTKFLAVEEMRRFPDQSVWYFLSEPSFSFRVFGEEVRPPYYLPCPGKQLPDEWHKIQHPGFREVHWTYYHPAPALSCNGIAIGGPPRGDWRLQDYLQNYTMFQISHPLLHEPNLPSPNISVFDPDGRLPLNLTRTALSEEYPFSAELRRDVVRDFLAFLLISAPTEPPCVPGALAKYEHIAYPPGAPGARYGQNSERWFSWCALAGGSCVATGSLLLSAGITHLLFYMAPNADKVYPPLQEETPLAYLFRPAFWYNQRQVNWVDVAREVLYPVGRKSDLPLKGARLAVPMKESIFLNTRGTLRRETRSRIRSGRQYREWITWEVGDCPPPSQAFSRLFEETADLPDDRLDHAIAEWYLPTQYAKPRGKTHSPISMLHTLWNEIIREPAIPYNVDERKAKLAHAFELLAPYIEAHRGMMTQKGSYVQQSLPGRPDPAESNPGMT